MNPWSNFLISITVRLVCGFVIGCIISFILGFRIVMRQIAENGFPVERFLIWGVGGALICALTTPRRDWPWSKE